MKRDVLRRLVGRHSALAWLYPGLGVKRWLLLLLVSVVLLGLGFAYLLRDLYETWTFPPAAYYLTLQFIPRVGRAALFGVAGLALLALSLVQLNRRLLSAFTRPGETGLAERLLRQRLRGKGPKVVAIGGGTGLPTLLRGLKQHTDNITAIVTVADDGGSSGRLRRELGVLPPGDFRNCIAALADAEPLTTQLFQYRFGEDSGLDGHSFGNLFIAAMAAVTGSFERALLESSRVLSVRGQILPSTLENVTLCADLREERGEESRLRRVAGESRIPAERRPIARVFLEPEGVRAYPGTVRAILEADLIVVGPGSLYTSILPNLLVRDIASALKASRALKVYVCNVATQPGETDGFSVRDHVRALEEHVGQGAFSLVLANDNLAVRPPAYTQSEPVTLDEEGVGPYRLVTADLVDPRNPWRHDAERLAETLMTLFNDWKASVIS